WGENFTDAGLTHLAKLKQLTSLHLGCCENFTDAGLAHLAKLPQLTSLHLGWCENFTDAGLVQLRPLQGLVELHIEKPSTIHAIFRRLLRTRLTDP
ncbi:MAG TPA: hypothetical protein P5102_11395, partial [Candidatus Competibacteraceae bacterium]|nr:hypothetical protein [Candidatus Competibacteraceae bacterium]